MDQEPGIFANPLRKGDTIAVISPAFRLNEVLPDHLARGRQFLIDQGFQVKIIYTPIDDLDFGAQVQQRCDEIHEAFQDPAVTAIICTVGGSESHELLPMLDYSLIRANPKIFIGFSDITSLHCGIFTQTGLRTFYGPMAIDPFGGIAAPNSFTTKAFFDVLTTSGQQPIGPVPISTECDVVSGVFDDSPGPDSISTVKPNPGWRWLRQGSAKGRIFGGCLEPLMNLPGSKFWPNFQGKVLLLETSLNEDGSKGVPLDKIRAQLASLRNLDVFTAIKGLVVGRSAHYDDEQNQEFRQIILNQTRGTEFPILIDVDIGHTAPIITVPLNAMVQLDSVGNNFSIVEHSVAENRP